MGYKQLWKILSTLEKEIYFQSNAFLLVEEVADIHMYWENKQYIKFRYGVARLMSIMRY